MKRVFLLLVVMVASRTAAQSPDPFLERLVPIETPDGIQDAAFAHYFERLGRWDFGPDVLVANWNAVTFSPTGTFVALDVGAGLAQYFDPSGQLIRELDPTECEPGFQGQLVRALFLHDGSFLIFPSGGVAALWFDAAGQCMDRFAYGAFLPLYVAGTGTGNLVAARFIPPEIRVQERASGGELITELGAFSEFANLNGMIAGGGLHRTDDGTLYFGQTATMDYAVFDSSGTRVGTIGEVPSYFQGMERDASSPTTSFQEYMGRISRQNSLRVRSFLMGDDKLLSIIDNGYEDENSDRRMGLQVISTNGQLLTPDHVFLRRDVTFLGSYAGLLFRRVITDSEENPHVVIYRFRGGQP